MFFPSRIATKREHRFLIGDRVFFASLPYFDFLPPTETARLRAPQHSRERARDSTATDNARPPRKTKSDPGTPTFSVAFSLLALSQLSRPCPFWLAFTTTPSATRELPPSPKKLQTNCGGGTHAARRSLRTPFPRHTYTLFFFFPSRSHRTRSRWPAEPPRCS